jgi:hypothetical protein
MLHTALVIVYADEFLVNVDGVCETVFTSGQLNKHRV